MHERYRNMGKAVHIRVMECGHFICQNERWRVDTLYVRIWVTSMCYLCFIRQNMGKAVYVLAMQSGHFMHHNMGNTVYVRVIQAMHRSVTMLYLSECGKSL